jgi:hypothetical protein
MQTQQLLQFYIITFWLPPCLFHIIVQKEY